MKRTARKIAFSAARPDHSFAAHARRATLAIFIFGCTACIPFSGYRESHGLKAGELRAKGEFDAAISEYLRHIDDRLAAPDRPPGENPYFYYLLIGDVYLDKGDETGAKEAYVRAQKEGVEKALIADRYRTLSERAEARNDLERAIELLREARELDPELMDFEIDRLHKKSLELEDRARSGEPAEPDPPGPPPPAERRFPPREILPSEQGPSGPGSEEWGLPQQQPTPE